MSKAYPELILTNFPDDIDAQSNMIDPSTPQHTLDIETFNTYMANGDYVSAANMLKENSDLSQMIFNAVKYNRHEHMLQALQKYYMQDIRSYITNVVKDRGEWIADVEYSKFDVVHQINNGAREYYMASNNVPAGTPLTDETHFIALTIRGEQGESGLGFNWNGSYDNTKEYGGNAAVAYDNKFWVNVSGSVVTGIVPGSNDGVWEMIVDFSPLAIQVSANTDELGELKLYIDSVEEDCKTTSAAQNERLSSAEKTINTHTTDINANKANINTNSAAINTLNTKIGTVTKFSYGTSLPSTGQTGNVFFLIE